MQREIRCMRWGEEEVKDSIDILTEDGDDGNVTW